MRLQISTLCLALLATMLQPAYAGMGNRASAPKYVPEPCQGDACRADDERSGLQCQGLLCSFSSAKSMQPPVTAAQADAQRAAAVASEVKPIEVVPLSKPSKTAKKKQAKTATAKKVSSKTDHASDSEK